MHSPIVSATLQSTCLATASNLCAQFIISRQEERPFTLDFFQLLRFVCLNLMTAPPNYHWQQFLERSFPAYIDPRPASADASGLELKPTNPDGPSPAALEAGAGASVPEPRFSLRNTLTKWFVDCITLGAIMNTMAFLVIMGAMKGQGLGQIYYNIQTEMIPIIVAGYKIWPIASIISFTFIPVHRRIVFLSFVGLMWGIYMSIVAARV